MKHIIVEFTAEGALQGCHGNIWVFENSGNTRYILETYKANDIKEGIFALAQAFYQINGVSFNKP